MDGKEKRVNVYDPQEAKRDAGLRLLLERALELKQQSEMGVDCCKDVKDVIQAADDYIKEAKSSNVAFLDMKVLHTSSIVLKNTMHLVTSELNTFDSMAYVDNMKMFVEGPMPFDDLSWCHKELVPMAEESIKVSPMLVYMLGSLEPGPLPPPRERCREKRPRLRDEPLKRPTQVEDLEKEETDMEERMRLMSALLRRRYQETGKPVFYFEFVLDPDSFSETVQNMFHLSHMIKEGLVELRADGNKQPVLLPANPADMMGQDRKKRHCQHLVLPFSMRDWQELQEVFQIKKAMIRSKRRKEK